MIDNALLEDVRDAKIPDWAMEDARTIWKGMGFVSDRLNQVPALALALVAVDTRAEQRGRQDGLEEAANVAFDEMFEAVNAVRVRKLQTAIRSLGEKT